MQAVGKLSSYITQGVYTVSGPFHPFGGAVDIVVVQQHDGSLKSSPWYVKFGKFQGVLKAKERVVDINVNGVDANFHMYLDPRGEAYFLREVDSEEVTPHSSSSFEEIDGKDHGKIPFKSKSMTYDFDQSGSDVSNGKVLDRNNSKRSRILGFVLGRRSMKEDILSKEENDSNSGRIASIESAQIAADLLEMKWSTNLSSRNKVNEHRGSSKDNGEITGGRLEASLVLHEQHFINKPEASGVDENIESDVARDANKEVDEEHCSFVENYVSEESSRTRLDDHHGTEAGLEIVSEICTEIASNQQGDTSVEVVSCSSVAVSVCQIEDDNHRREEVSEQVVEEQLIFGELDDSNRKFDQNNGPDPPGPPPVRICQKRFTGEFEELKRNIKKCTSNVDIPRICDFTNEEVGRKAKSLPNMWSRFDSPIPDNHDDSQFYSPVAKFRSSNWDLVREDASRIVKANLGKELQHGADNLPKDLKDGGGGGSWSLWPFRRAVNKTMSQKDENGKKDSDVDMILEMDGEKETCSPQSDKMHTRALTPTSDQLASLNLAEGQNTVTFTFSTSVLGPQKVDARIYLWRWDTRIVISDVDGTITKSDVLGQFMPLVGRDWSHIGVTHLFSGIKENGYQMLYLSARAISQASITRQFLFNLKQDGKALPDGPVVISPDGLFPSLFREVIRRAPHEFKIACLEDIKACFPSDRNPFYAGFGNRDTDEFSYLKVGIPKGKIFIINPKGEVVVNRCIDSRSYGSLHALVNDIFPPISVHEEEDYNSWNFWKLPPPTVE